jgi:hypothetical protein
MQLNNTESITQPPDDIDEVDVVADEYDEVAEIIESYDEEKEPHDPKSEQVQDMLSLLIDNTAAYLEEQDRESDAQAMGHYTDGADGADSRDPRNDVEDSTGRDIR